MATVLTGRPNVYGDARLWIWFAFLLALTVRLVIASSSVRVPLGDETGYISTAIAIASGQGHVTGEMVAFKPPMYPSMLAVAYRVGGDERSARTLQAILGASLCLLIAWFGWFSLGPAAAVGGAWLAAVYPVFLALTERLLAEALFVWLVTAAVACAAWLLAAPSWRRASLLGAVCGVLTLTRSAGAGLVIVLAAIVVVIAREPRLRARIGLAALVLVTCSLIVAPWTIRNWVRLDAFVPVASEFGRNLYSGWVSVPEGKIFGGTAVDANTRLADSIISEPARDRFLLDKAIEYLRANPDVIPRYAFLKTLYFWSPFDWDVLGDGEAAYNGVYVALVPFTLIGLWHASRRARTSVWVCLATVIYFWAVALLASTTPRYRYPVEGALFPFAGLGVGLSVVNLTAWRPYIGFAAPWVACNLIAIAFDAQVKFAARTILSGVGLW